MVALSKLNQERVFFHLGMGNRSNIDAGDVARVLQACETIASDYIHSQILRLLDICDKTREQRELISNTWYDRKELISGDINRGSQSADPIKQQRIWEKEYLKRTDELAQILACSNYNHEGMGRYLHSPDAIGAYLKVLPGVADTSVASRIVMKERNPVFGYALIGLWN